MSNKPEYSKFQIVEVDDKPAIYQDGSSHVLSRHDHATWHPQNLQGLSRKTSNKLPYSDKSKFNSHQIAQDAIAESAGHPAVVSENGYLVTTFDMGHDTGYDGNTGESVSSVTVVTDRDGKLITAYPGTSFGTGLPDEDKTDRQPPVFYPDPAPADEAPRRWDQMSDASAKNRRIRSNPARNCSLSAP